VRLEGRETPPEGGQRQTVGRDREQQATGNRRQATGNGQRAIPARREQQPPATCHCPQTANRGPQTSDLAFCAKKVGETLLAQGSVIALRLGRGPSSSEARFAKLPRRRVGSIPVGAHLHRSSLRCL
jgi:hypothetical protein